MDGPFYNPDEEFGDWPDEWGNVRCQNCGFLNDLPDGGREIDCGQCGAVIDSRTGEVITPPKEARP